LIRILAGRKQPVVREAPCRATRFAAGKDENLLQSSSGIRRGLQSLARRYKEIFDESAYPASSNVVTHNLPIAYAEFLAESRQQRERRPRCC
jgi:hypothetical protein